MLPRLMETLTITDLREEHLPAAAELLAKRQDRLRHLRPELPEAFTHADACRPLIEAVLANEGSYGVVATDGTGRLVGYLAGWHRTEEIWGRACWSPIEGQALAPDVDAERIRDLYAAWAEHFVQRGVFRQYVHAPADDAELQAAWFRTGFGQMQAHATREIPAEIPPRTADSYTIRRGGPADADLLEPLFPAIPAVLMLAPAYAISPPERFETLRADYEVDLREPRAHYWLAEEDGVALGVVAFEDVDPALMVPDRATAMEVGMTRPDARRRGIMRALLEAGWADARERGIRWVVTDWRTASLPTHRSWTALGHRPLYYRLHRHIDERIAWARSNAEAASD
jgi:GNAT superfamily N-acetyltransferase